MSFQPLTLPVFYIKALPSFDKEANYDGKGSPLQALDQQEK